MTVHVLSTLPGVTPGDSTGGSTNAATLNAYIAANVAPGDVIDHNCPISPNGTIVVQDKLGVAWRGAGAMGSRISPNGNFDGIQWNSNESCVLSDVGITPKVTQTAGVGLVVDEYANSRVGLDNKFVRVNVFDRTRQQSRWSLGTGAPYKGVVVKGSGGGYKTRFMSCQVNGARSNGWEFGVYNQSSRGPVGVVLQGCESAVCQGDGFAIYAAEALEFNDGTEALQNHGRGIILYPDNGGFVELFMNSVLCDTNWGHGLEVNAGGSGVGGKLKVVLALDSWFSNNGNPDADPNQGTTWNTASCGVKFNQSPEEVVFNRNRMAVNAESGGWIAAARTLQCNGNEARNNGQAGNGNGLLLNYCPTSNQFNDNLADGQVYSGYPAKQNYGLGTTGGVAANATGNVSKNPNSAGAYFWHTTPNAANNQ